jgi:hypothetical protein
MAVWAAGRLLPDTALHKLADAHEVPEQDEDVRAEWREALRLSNPLESAA